MGSFIFFFKGNKKERKIDTEKKCKIIFKVKAKEEIWNESPCVVVTRPNKTS